MSTPVVVVGAFTLTGNLKAYLNNPFVGPPGPAVVDRIVTGKGGAILELQWIISGGAKVFQFRRITYHFLR